MSDPAGWQKALELIEQEKEAQTGRLNLSGLGLTELPDELWELTHLHSLFLDAEYRDMGEGANLWNKLPQLLEASKLLEWESIVIQMVDYAKKNDSKNSDERNTLNINNLSTIPYQITTLKHLRQLTCNGIELTQIPHFLIELTQLQVLDLTGNKLTSLPYSLSKLINLFALSLKSNQFNTLPDSLGNLSNLIVLDISSNQLTFLPDRLNQLSNLSYLNLNDNYFSSLSKGLESLTNLSVLLLSKNKLTALPDLLGNLTNLFFLDLSENKLTALPDLLGNLTNLSFLDLSENKLTALPNSLSNLTQLTELNLSNNLLSFLPDSLGNLTQLASLILWDNQLTSLPNFLDNLSNLSILSLSQNQLPFLPDWLGNLTQLTSLYLSSNHLTTLPNSLGNLTQLSFLDLRNNKLTALPDELGNLSQLSKLDLSSNQLTTLPNTLGNLTQLSFLDLSNNHLTSLPEWLGNLTNLTSLDLGNNQLTTLPNSLGNLTNLASLALGANRLTTLSDSLDNLTQLSELNLSFNQLTSLPNSLGNLTNLTSLDLRSNQLSFLPDELGNLTQLYTLDFSRNQINRLPQWLQQLPDLIRGLENNPLPIPPEIFMAGDYFLWEESPPSKPILDAYFGACKPLHEAKLLLVGEGEVGKTSVIRRVVYGDFEAQGKTDGIDVHHWLLPIDDHQVQVNVWDFGGQEIYRSTHQFFFTKRSVYVVVVSGRQDNTKTLEKWVKTVQQLAGEEAPILVVVNKIDEHLPQLDERGLKGKYPQIEEVVYLSCKGNYMQVRGQRVEGVGSLQKLLQQIIAQLPHVNDLLHEAWWNVKNSLQNSSYEVMSYEKFREICEQHRVQTEVAQKFLAQLLHDLGVVVHFQENPLLQNIGILNPEWVTQGVYAILNSEKIQRQNGRLQLTDLKGILDPKAYPSERHLYLIGLMEQFELCVELPLQKWCYLMPSLLAPERPVFDWPSPGLTSLLALEYQYEDFLPDTILPRLIAQNYEKLDLARTWRFGFVLQTEEGDEALVQGDETDRKLSIWIAGSEKTRRTLLAIVRERLAGLHAQFKKLRVKEMCPAVDLEGNVVALIAYKGLLNAEKRNKKIIFDSVLDTDIDVQASLNLVDEPEQRVIVELRDYLTEKYSEGELKLLLSDFGLELEKIVDMSEAYSNKVLEVVQYAKRRPGLFSKLRERAYTGRGEN